MASTQNGWLIASSFGRALGYSLMPSVLFLSLMPLVIMALGAWLIGHVWWPTWVDALGAWVGDVGWLSGFWRWLAQWMGGDAGPNALASALLMVLITPLVVMASLLLVALLMTPAVVRLVAKRRFPALEKHDGASWWTGLWWSLSSTLMATVVFVITLPLWLIPPLFMLLPPLIWGWLSYRVFSFDTLAEHANAAEREAVMAAHRWPLLAMGIAAGMMGALPALLWASGVWFSLVLAVVLVPLSIWLYTLVFAFTSLWFAHYLLQALDTHRQRHMPPSGPAAPEVLTLENT